MLAEETGLCIRCCKRPRRAEYKTCEVCAEKAAQLARDRRVRLVAQGLCSRCLKNPARPGKKTCEVYVKPVMEWREKTKPKRSRPIIVDDPGEPIQLPSVLVVFSDGFDVRPGHALDWFEIL